MPCWKRSKLVMTRSLMCMTSITAYLLVFTTRFSFNYIATSEGYTFIAVCDEDFNSRATFAFLETLKSKFKPGQEESRVVAEMEKQMVSSSHNVLTF